MIAMRRLLGLTVLLIPVAMLSGGCRASQGAEGATPDEQRSTIRSEAQKTLQELHASKPETRDKVAKAAGYAYFSNVNVNVLLLSSENGYGVVHDNRTGKDTYMKMAGAGVGVGMGVKDYRAILVFADPELMRNFMEKGMDFGGSADASAKTSKEGGANQAGGSAVPGLEVYQITKAGAALQATVQGTKYWRDDKLNQ